MKSHKCDSCANDSCWSQVQWLMKSCMSSLELKCNHIIVCSLPITTMFNCREKCHLELVPEPEFCFAVFHLFGTEYQDIDQTDLKL